MTTGANARMVVIEKAADAIQTREAGQGVAMLSRAAMTTLGIDGLFDRSFGGLVIYNPKAMEVLPDVPQSSRTEGKSSALSADGSFKGWPKFKNWNRSEYNDVVSLLPESYRNDPHRQEPLSAKDWDALDATAVPELEALNKTVGEGTFRIDGGRCLGADYIRCAANIALSANVQLRPARSVRVARPL